MKRSPDQISLNKVINLLYSLKAFAEANDCLLTSFACHSAADCLIFKGNSSIFIRDLDFNEILFATRKEELSLDEFVVEHFPLGLAETKVINHLKNDVTPDVTQAQRAKIFF